MRAKLIRSRAAPKRLVRAKVCFNSIKDKTDGESMLGFDWSNVNVCHQELRVSGVVD